MSLDIRITRKKLQLVEETLFEVNITHNLNKMAMEVGLYKCMWRPEELGITKCKELIPYLTKGILKLQNNPEYYKQFNPANKWGEYANLLQAATDYLTICTLYPQEKIKVWK